MASQTIPKLKDRVRKLAEAIVLCDLRDLTELASIHSILEEVDAGCVQESLKAEGALARATAAMIERVILSEESDPRAALQAAGEAIGQLQAVLVEGREIGELRAPEPIARLMAAQTGEEQAPEVAEEAAGAAEPLPPAVDEAILAEFLSRQPAVLEELEALIMALEAGGDAKELARVVHTLKGEAGLLGMKAVEESCHRVEDVFSSGALKERIDPLLEWQEWLGRYFAACASGEPRPELPEAILRRIAGGEHVTEAPATAEPAPAAPATAPAPAPATPPADPELLAEFINESTEHLDRAETAMLTLETDPENLEAINAVFRAFHTIKGVAGFLGLEDVASLAHEAENLLDGARKQTLRLTGGATDVVFDSIDALKRMIAGQRAYVEHGTPPAADPVLPSLLEALRRTARGEVAPAPRRLKPHAGDRIGEILVNEGIATREAVETALARQREHPDRRVGELLVDQGAADARTVAEALRAQRTSAPPQVKETVKVDAGRLDALVEMIGELVIAESMVSQATELRQHASAALLAHLKELDKITRELQEIGLSLRMIPLRSTFQKMARLARDVARKADKQVEFIMFGEDTELDKMVVDQIGDPLIHMVRNAVDHGLEPDAEARRAAGKPEVGRVELRAFHRGGKIYIEIEDDGRGLDRDAILAKARERGLVGPEDEPSDREVFQLIFHPGLSTARKVTDVSGRGVGMDVVRKNVEALRGQIDIQSRPGKGSIFTICLPLTLAIIDGMVLRVGNERYIMPTLSIQTTIRAENGMISSVHGRGLLLRLQGELIPVFRLDELFAIEGAETDLTRAVIVIVENDGRRIGVVADELLGQQQIVIKPLGDGMQQMPGLSGGAIMPDGQVSLILDIAGLMKLAHGEITASGAANTERESA